MRSVLLRMPLVHEALLCVYMALLSVQMALLSVYMAVLRWAPYKKILQTFR